MGSKYDAIVIGAGLGGLSAATMLARNGLSVLLLERHNVPGGYATSFVRGRYEFEVALHELSGIGPPEHRRHLYRYLEELGVAQKVEFVQVPTLYRSVFPDLDLSLTVGRENYEATLTSTFPHEAAGIRRFLDRVYAVNREFARISNEGFKSSRLLAPIRFPNMFRYLCTTWAQVLNRDVRDPRARAVLSQYWSYFGLPPSKVSFVYFSVGLASYVKNGPSLIRGRSQALSSAFLARFEELGGQARMNCGASRITTSNDRVTGVITDEGEEIAADWVLSNTDPITTCRDMIGDDKVPAPFFARLQSSEVACSIISVYLGVARPPEDLGLTEHEIFVNSNYDIDRHYERAQTLDPPEAVAVTCYNAVLQDISPPGTSMVVLSSLAFGRPWCELRPEHYVDTKHRIADAMLRQAERIAPDLRRYAEVVEVATPLTNMRYAGTRGGSIYGFAQPPHDSLLERMRHRGPLDRLYFVGAWTQPGGGFEPAMLSGQMAAGEILHRIANADKES